VIGGQAVLLFQKYSVSFSHFVPFATSLSPSHRQSRCRCWIVQRAIHTLSQNDGTTPFQRSNQISYTWLDPIGSFNGIFRVIGCCIRHPQRDETMENGNAHKASCRLEIVVARARVKSHQNIVSVLPQLHGRIQQLLAPPFVIGKVPRMTQAIVCKRKVVQ
jgi:hypothetical protein